MRLERHVFINQLFKTKPLGVVESTRVSDEIGALLEIRINVLYQKVLTFDTGFEGTVVKKILLSVVESIRVTEEIGALPEINVLYMYCTHF